MDRMQIYTIAFSALCLVGFGLTLGQQDGEKVTVAIFRMIATLPLVGRIFGWW